MVLVQKEPKKIYIGGDITDMQGPCPTGFHVPSKDENVALVAAMTALGIDTSNGNCMKTYMKMPFAGDRSNSSAGVNDQDTYALYWSSTAKTTNAYSLLFNSTTLKPQSGYNRSIGFSVRCFKNSPTIPTASWTTLFDGSSIAANAGIFHNTTDGLISISSDGQNWITIQDKNLGATTVYNDGDTLSQANCGNYYQWGNNYGFPRTGSVTTSSTQVDASNYGPGNYYSSSTFITVSASPYDWSSVQNDDLWGGVSGAAKEVKSVYLGSIKVRPENKELCFTANTANSTVKLSKAGSPTSPFTLETSTNGGTRTTYTIDDTITLSNVGDKVYFRNTSETTTDFNKNNSNYYYFAMTGSINASGDVTSLINKNCTNTLSSAYCFYRLFHNCSALIAPPELPATTLCNYCYNSMFMDCSNLITAPSLPAITVNSYCYQNMFTGCTNLETLPKLPSTAVQQSSYNYMFKSCSKIKMSTSQTGIYQTPYRIPATGTGTAGSGALTNMFQYSGGTFNGTPTVNTTYYTSNTLVG